MKEKQFIEKKKYHDKEPRKDEEDVIFTEEEIFRINYFIKIEDPGWSLSKKGLTSSKVMKSFYIFV